MKAVDKQTAAILIEMQTRILALEKKIDKLIELLQKEE
jgi:hypothetical protein